MIALVDQIERMRTQALAELEQVESVPALEDWRVRYLGRKGQLADLTALLKSVPSDERPAAGKAANAAKEQLESALVSCRRRLSEKQQAVPALDVTLPGIPPAVGGLHVIRKTLYEMLRIFAGLGFSAYETNEVELDEYNFTLLNLPPDHPARDMWDTMYISSELMLRTHTSPGQMRAMRQFCPEPLRLVFPGKVHRYEAVDASHESMFYQLEGLAVGEGITLAGLKGAFEAFAHQMFGPDRSVRFRGSYFPFTEPSVEIDILCNCLGSGCRLCKGTGWLEVSGGGMVHPTVLENGGYDPSRVTGFAWGMGVDRVAMLVHGIDEIRYFYGNDLRFLQQFR